MKEDHFLEHFFSPESVAVVGATNNTFKMNFRILQNLIDLDFQGKIYPVNPGVQEISGIRAFARLQDIPDKIDLVVSAVPASKTMDIVKDCDEIGARHLVIITGGLSFAFQSGFYDPKISCILSRMGVNKMLDMGNKMDINEVDALDYFSRDEDTKVIAI